MFKGKKSNIKTGVNYVKPCSEGGVVQPCGDLIYYLEAISGQIEAR